MDRYIVTQTPDQRRWVILDLHMFGYCTLPDDPGNPHPNLLPLEWSTRPAAEAWLNRCFNAWAKGIAPAPTGWRPLPYEPSPWAR